MKVLPYLHKILQPDVIVEEEFTKARVSCSFASATDSFTLGFTDTRIAKPKTLLKGCYLKNANSVDFILRKKFGEKKFLDVVFENLLH